MKRRVNRHRPKDNSTRDGEGRHTRISADRSEKDYEKYGVVAVMMDQDEEEGYDDEREDG